MKCQCFGTGLRVEELLDRSHVVSLPLFPRSARVNKAAGAEELVFA